MKITLATTTMDISPAPLAERLERAEALLRAAAAQGAQVVALPELFNTGYRYHPDNFALAEPAHGPTAQWLLASARRYSLHIAGTLLLREGRAIHNALLLAAPDGQTWRYDKLYPWGWERAYFCPGRSLQVAQTSLGMVGLLICWDVGHPRLWRAYAGQVDWMLVCSCPPKITEPLYLLPDGRQVGAADLGPLMQSLEGSAEEVFVKGVQEQAAWLGVPLVKSSGSGNFCSTLPNPRASLALMLPFAPWAARYLSQAGQIELHAPMTPAARILDAAGQTLTTADVTPGDHLSLAEVSLPAHRPVPQRPQPRSRASWIVCALSDGILPAISAPVYRAHI